jgi:hypothetical protein
MVVAAPELLGRALDGLAGLETVPAERVREIAERSRLFPGGAPSREVPRPSDAARIGRALGAGYFVTGSVTSLAGRVQVVATLYRDDPTPEPLASSDAAGPADSLFDIVERTAVQLAAAVAQRSDIAKSEVASTRSIEALRAYLEGERIRRDGRLELASKSFERAVRADSTFALAWLRLASVLRSTEHTARMHEAARNALRYARDLSLRDRLLIAGFVQLVQGRTDDAESTLRQILAAHPGDDEARALLAGLLVRQNPFRGRSIDEATPLYARLVADSLSFFAAAQFLANAAARRGDIGTLDSIAAEPRIRDRAPSRALVAIHRAMATHDTVALDSIGRVWGPTEDLRVTFLVWFSSANSRDPSGVGPLIRAMLDAPHSPALRAWLALTLADLALVQGRPADAEPWRARASRDAPRRTLEVRAMHATLPFVPVAPDTLRALRARLTATRHAPALNPPFDTFAPGAATVLRPYLLGLLSARLGEREEAERWARETERATTDSTGLAYARALAASVRAHLAWWQGDAAKALAHLESAGLPVSRDYGPTHLGTMAAERWLRGVALLALGREREARGWLASLGELSFAEHVYRAPAALLLARAEARAGDWSAAAQRFEDAGRPLARAEGPWRALRDAARDEGARAAWIAGASPRITATTAPPR